MCGSEVLRDVQRLDAIVGGTDFMAGELKLECQRFSRIAIVIRHQDAARLDNGYRLRGARPDSSQPSPSPAPEFER